MSNVQHTRFDSVLRQQQPSGEPLFEIMQTIAATGLGDLQTLDDGISGKDGVKVGTAGKQLLQCTYSDCESFSRYLDHSPMGAPAQPDGYPYWRKTLSPNDANFNTLAILPGNYKRNESMVQKVGELEFAPWLMQVPVMRKVNVVQM